MRRIVTLAAVLSLLLGLGVVAPLARPAPLEAQLEQDLADDPLDQPAERVAPEPRITDQLALARVCASEIGLHWVVPAAGATTPAFLECAAIARVLRGRASSIRSGAQRYSRRVFDRTRAGRRAWLVHLRPDGRRPLHWPDARVANWSYSRRRWLALYEAAGRIVRGELVDVCASDIDHWGMRSGVDLERAVRFGWTEVDCAAGDAVTRNAFWHVPRREEG